jgi:hypothetical protein
MPQGTIDFPGGFVHFGDWNLTCGEPLATFTPKFGFSESFSAKKEKPEEGFIDKVKGWFEDLFGDKKEQAAKAIWKKLDADTDGVVVVSAAASLLVGECKEGGREVSIKCYLSCDVWYGATAKEESVGGKVKATTHFELTLPGSWATVSLGKCPCPKATNLLVMFPNLWDGGVYISTAGTPRIAVAAAGSDAGSVLPVPTLVEIEPARAVAGNVIQADAIGRGSVGAKVGARSPKGVVNRRG